MATRKKAKKPAAKQMSPKEWLEKYLKPLEGATINKVEILEENDPRSIISNSEMWPIIHVSQSKEKGGEVFSLMLSRDPEGNGPGFLLGLPRPITD
jgi:hypothetical protein